VRVAVGNTSDPFNWDGEGFCDETLIEQADFRVIADQMKVRAAVLAYDIRTPGVLKLCFQTFLRKDFNQSFYARLNG